MKLNLKNPIVFFDLETTGTNINTDRIVEICYLKVYPNGNEEAKTLRINPEMHIPEASSAVHGIYDADVADCPTFKEVAKRMRSGRIQLQPFRHSCAGGRISACGSGYRHDEAQICGRAGDFPQNGATHPFGSLQILLRKESGGRAYGGGGHTCHL